MRALLSVLFAALFFSPLLVIGADSGFVRGAIAVRSFSGQYEIQKIGSGEVGLDAAALPNLLPSHLRINAKSAGGLLATTSNGMEFYFEGPGFMAIDSFRHLADGADPSIAGTSATSRIILSLRNGYFAMDDRELGGVSQVILETPLGRLITRNSLWMMQVEFDERTRIFSFSVECAAGLIRFKDRQGRNYVLQTSQRLAGAGSAMAPTIEVTDLSGDGLDFFARFEEASAEAAEQPLEAADFAPFLSEIPSSQTPAAPTSRVAAQATEVDQRPLVIEYEPAPPPVVPFRGQLKLKRAAGDEL